MNYRRTEEPLYDRHQTADKIKWLIDNFAGDLKEIDCLMGNGKFPLASLSLANFHKFVRLIPYKMDRRPVERIARPKWIIENAAKGIDCKKKAILMGSWCKVNGIPFRLIGSSCRRDKKIHHIFPQAFLGGEFKNIDATYSDYRIDEQKTVTAMEVL